MYVLKEYNDTVEIPDFTQDPEIFEWKFNNYYRTLGDEVFFEEVSQH